MCPEFSLRVTGGDPCNTNAHRLQWTYCTQVHEEGGSEMNEVPDDVMQVRKGDRAPEDGQRRAQAGSGTANSVRSLSRPHMVNEPLLSDDAQMMDW